MSYHTEISAGGLVFRFVDGEAHVLLIHDRYGNWGCPKGHVEEEESADAAALREIREETGLRHARIREPLGTIEWSFEGKTGTVRKRCHYFLCDSSSGDASPQLDEGVTECGWFGIMDALQKIPFENVRGVLSQAAERLDTIAISRAGQPID